jgi:hypothetical protein
MLLRLLLTLSCLKRSPSIGIIAAARHRVYNTGLIAAGLDRAFG